jgi:predicted molibdopterin-dependent oxidoreductase YjgC
VVEQARGAVRVAEPGRGTPVTIRVGDRSIQAFSGETLATVLLAAGIRAFRTSVTRGEPRGPLCLMGTCQDCLVDVGGVAELACQCHVRDGMVVVLHNERES